MRNPSTKSKGFTMVELLVTMAIAGVIMAIGVPSLKDFLTSNRLTSNLNSLVGLVNYARSESIVRNQAVVICPKTTGSTAITCINSEYWGQYEIQAFVDIDGNNQRNSSDIFLKSIPVIDSSGTNFAVIKNATPRYLVFESLGYTRSPASIKVYNPSSDTAYESKYGRTLCISKPGRVRVSPHLATCSDF